jgi:ARG/rhodanese/phosphatase superfamily protein
MKKQAFVLTLGVVLLSVVAGLGMLINAQGLRSSSGAGVGNGMGAADGLGAERTGSARTSLSEGNGLGTGNGAGRGVGEGRGNGNGEGNVAGAGQVTSIQAGNYRLSGPYTHKNLTIFLVHGKNVFAGKSFMTLQEAMTEKKVVVYETKTVNELAIENLSDEDIYVQAGEIVKGGQQDRMIGVDLIVPRKSGKMPIAAFCVEHGRWSGRGNERTTVFSSSSDAVTTKSIKLAAKKSSSQGEVWKSVTVAQDKLSQNVGARVNSEVSASSLQLAVEHSKVRETADSYINALSNIVNGSNDVIGYVFAINGKVNSADVYGSSSLFKKLWPKLLKANAIEAIAELQTEKFAPAKPESAKAFLTDSEKAKGTEKEVSRRVGLVTAEDEENVFFETRDRAQKDAWVHRNYIKKN